MTDSELATLQEKVKRLTHDRDVALRLANKSTTMLQDMKVQVEHYRTLFEEANDRIELAKVLRGENMRPRKSLWNRFFKREYDL